MPGSSEKIKDTLLANQVTWEWKSLTHGYNSNGIWGLSLLHKLLKSKRWREVFEYRTSMMEANVHVRTFRGYSANLSKQRTIKNRQRSTAHDGPYFWVTDYGEIDKEFAAGMSILLAEKWLKWESPNSLLRMSIVLGFHPQLRLEADSSAHVHTFGFRP